MTDEICAGTLATKAQQPARLHMKQANQTGPGREPADSSQTGATVRARGGPATILTMLLLLLAGAIALWSLRNPVESTQDRVFRSGTIRIGYALEAPYAFCDAEGRVTGESPEVAKAVWQRLGVETIEWVQTDFGSLIPQLLAGRFDQVASGLFIRPDRERLVLFTAPAICPAPALLVRQGNPLALHGYGDIAGKIEARLAVIDGAIEREDALRAGVPGERIHSYPHAGMAVQALRSGLVDGLALSAPSIEQLAVAYPDMQRALPFATPGVQAGCGAFAFRPADRVLRDRFNQELERYLGTKAHLELIQSFGFTLDCLPAATKPGKEPTP